MSTFRFFSAVCLIVVAFLLLETDASPKPNIKGKNRASSSGNAKPNAGRLTLQNQRDVDAHGTGNEIIYTLNGKPLTTTGLLVSSTAVQKISKSSETEKGTEF
uniref:Salivary lipocalin n=1 Tax=Globodera pallida TaxID=36090 RepID=A0A183BP78_GLOPA